ncbi:MULTISPECIES: hypothetical protein [Enterococcus]|uniref:Uncharacterized protein n=3 Tax=root TaxID=1 RepID=A0A179ET84_ENTTH|nr:MULTISPECIES: hypothetical protein [Enterococcus]MBO0431191.1 hypothetical protein [Enterococcus sp. DIV0660C]MBO0481178.1 hypothetical protein [Enterococcus sp. MSG2901]MDA3965530.1 hypothetical protein [Enterococcus thailandicus]MDA3972569.1 hypothetical protein [Enterococcus thailandicus]MDA3975065.1 hypothetical protein [Enterococcus thailandicus]
MKKRQKKKNAYKNYIRSIFTGYEKMLENPELGELRLSYLNEETLLTRDEQQRIHFTTRELPNK